MGKIVRGKVADQNLSALAAGHEHPTGPGSALVGVAKHRDHQCALHVAGAGGSARDRRGGTARTSLSCR